MLNYNDVMEYDVISDIDQCWLLQHTELTGGGLC